MRRTPLSRPLEDKLVGELALGETPGRLEVFCEVLSLLDGLDDGLVDLLLVGGLGCREGLLLGLAVLEELSLCGLGLLGGGLGEVGIVDLLVNLDSER